MSGALLKCSRFPGVMFWTLAYDGFFRYNGWGFESARFKTGKSITPRVNYELCQNGMIRFPISALIITPIALGAAR